MDFAVADDRQRRSALARYVPVNQSLAVGRFSMSYAQARVKPLYPRITAQKAPRTVSVSRLGDTRPPCAVDQCVAAPAALPTDENGLYADHLPRL